MAASPLGGGAGCGSFLRNAAEEVTPAVVAGAVEGMTDPLTQRHIVSAIDEGQIETVSTRISAGAIDGMLDTLEDPTRKTRLKAIVNELAANASGAMVDSMIDHALDEKAQSRMRKAMRAAMSDLVTVVIETVEAETMNAEDRTETFGVSAREIVRQATLGFQDALDDTRRDRASGAMLEEDGSLLIAANNASKTGNRIVWTLAFGLATVALLTVVILVWAIRKNRLRRLELQQRDDALLLLTDAIKATTTQPGAEQLHTVIKSSIREKAAGEHIRKLLGEQGRHLLGILEKTD